LRAALRITSGGTTHRQINGVSRNVLAVSADLCFVHSSTLDLSTDGAALCRLLCARGPRTYLPVRISFTAHSDLEGFSVSYGTAYLSSYNPVGNKHTNLGPCGNAQLLPTLIFLSLARAMAPNVSPHYATPLAALYNTQFIACRGKRG